jgi:glycosyltransferase domain-containing protein
MQHGNEAVKASAQLASASSNTMLITIVIPTHNRSALLRRAIEFYSQAELGHVRVCVVDSSEGEELTRNERLLSRAPFVQHLKYTGLSFPAKLEAALGTLQCQFVAISGDDDFHDPKACVEAARFLRENHGFALGHGFSFAAIVEDSGACTLHNYHQSEICSEAAVDRLMYHLAHYCPTFYSVHRREQALKNMRLVK